MQSLHMEILHNADNLDSPSATELQRYPYRFFRGRQAQLCNGGFVHNDGITFDIITEGLGEITSCDEIQSQCLKEIKSYAE